MISHYLCFPFLVAAAVDAGAAGAAAAAAAAPATSTAFFFADSAATLSRKLRSLGSRCFFAVGFFLFLGGRGFGIRFFFFFCRGGFFRRRISRPSGDQAAENQQQGQPSKKSERVFHGMQIGRVSGSAPNGQS